MPRTNKKHPRLAGERHHVKAFDRWTIVHLTTGLLLAWIMPPLIGLVIMTLWEPLELLILSPLLGRAGIVFGDESLRNSLTDIVFNGIGLALGYWLLRPLATPPFHIF